MAATPNTKDRLISTAMELVWQNSYGSVSVDDICKAADVKKGSFYHYFKSKADLAIAVMEASYDESRQKFDALFSSSVPPLQRFENFVDAIYEKQKEAAEKYGRVCGCPTATLGCEMAGQDESIRTKAKEIFDRYAKYYESTLRDMVAEGTLPQNTDIEATAQELHNYGMGIAMTARIQNSLDPIKNDFKRGIMRILNVQHKELETV